MLPRLLTFFEIQKYYQNERKSNDVYSKNNLPKTKDGAYSITLAECKLIETHWINIYVIDNNGSTS